MRYLLTGLFLCCTFVAVQAQYIITLTIQNNEHEPLPSATVNWLEGGRSQLADSSGVARISGVSAGLQTFSVSHVGYQEETLTITITSDTTIMAVLQTSEEETEEVVVKATRTSRTITNTPTRIEVISGEELDEKTSMKPGDIRMMLNESTGIQTQQTSATSYNAAIRIQGLDGRYTQLLRDGYPLYAGFSGGLSILQIAPVDLRQVEVIKGSSSTLYGGGAIAGLINLVSKTPGKAREANFLLNGTTAGGLDLSGFYSQQYGKAGVTVYAARNSTAPFDPAGIGLTAIPKSERYTINPRVFLYGKKTTADVGISFITEDRTGGNIDYIKHGGTGYYEHNNSDRITTQLGVAHQVSEHATLQFKNSYSSFDRRINIPAYSFDARQQLSFSELTWNAQRKKTEWIIGTNLLTDDLKQKQTTTSPLLDYHYNTLGVFMQNTWSISPTITLESGLRGDYVNQYGLELLPRISALIRLSPALTTRIGGGFGYKTPTVFNEESERIQYQNLLPIDPDRTRNEQSVGGNWDVNYRTHIGPANISLNQLFFYTRLNHPLVLVGAPGGKISFVNADGHLDTKGIETNLRLLYGAFKLFVGYTYTDANTHYSGVKAWLPLTARHRLNNVLMYEIEDKLKLGLEAYYFSPQLLNDGATGQPYWITGFMAEKLWEKFSVFINFENFTDTRQTHFDTIYNGTIDNPVFRDIYAPVEGIVVNGGVKIRL